MHCLEDFAATESKEWKFTFTDPVSCIYPRDGILKIARNRDDTVNLAWKDAHGNGHQIAEIPFDAKYGRLNGTSDGYTVTVTIVHPEKTRIVGVIEGSGLPEAGTWGADATGGMG